jgi:hypothetical protein
MPARKKTNKSKSETSSSDKKNKSKSSSSKTKTASKAKASTKKTTAKKPATKKRSSTKKSPSTKKKVDEKTPVVAKEEPKEDGGINNRKKEIKVQTYSDRIRPKDESQSIKEEKTEDVSTDLGFDEVIGRTQIDSQKKFYQELNKEIEQKHLEGDYEVEKKVEKEIKPIKTSVGLYRRRAFFFIALTVILLVAIFYFSFSKLTIAISPSEEVVNNNVLIDVYNSDNNAALKSASSLSGNVSSITSTAEEVYSSTGEEIIGEEVVGRVKIINNYSKNQALVATTRLLSPDDKLYRIKETVNVPANSSIEVEIYADEVKKDRAIGPSTFIIPGLWAGLQDDIYAESEEAFVYRTKVNKYVTVSDIEGAKEDLRKQMIEKAKDEANRMFDNRYHILYDIDESFSTFDLNALAGDEVEEFNISGESQVVVIAFLKSEAKKLAQDKLKLLVPGDKELKEFDESNLSYTLDNYNIKEGIATLKISFSGLMTIDEDTEIVDRSQLVNLTREQIRKYLDTYPEIKNYTLDFQPAFLNKAPSLADRIEIKVAQ